VAHSIATSPEYRGDLVDAFFKRFLHRDPGSSERNQWIQALQNGSTDEGVIALIVGSDEYYARDPSWKATIHWGDGSHSKGDLTGTKVSGSHVYESKGKYAIKVRLVDDRGVRAGAIATADVRRPQTTRLLQ
jgi:hypothetical protein